MKIISQANKPKLIIVCCLHGDELFGLKVFKHYQSTPKLLDGIKLILANEEAIKQNVRGIDADLNRSFPGSREGNAEEQLASQINAEIHDAPYLIDIHTTTSDIQMTPIITDLNDRTRKIIQGCESDQIAHMQKPLGANSLIGQVAGGVSLEFNESYAKTKAAMQEIERIVQIVLEKKSSTPKQRTIYQLTQTIPNKIKLPSNATNFTYIPSLQMYPFLLHEKSYTTHQGFCGKAIINEII